MRFRFLNSLALYLSVLLLGATDSFATVTIRNFYTDVAGLKHSVIRLDSSGHALDAHDGQVVQDVNDTQWFYRIGTSYDCGRKWQWNSTPFCGFKSYRTKDFKTWYDMGFLFDASGSTWQTRCVNGETFDGCYRPHVIYHSGSSKWKLWVNVSGVAGPNYQILESTNLAGPYTEVGSSTISEGGDFSLLKDDNGDGYLAYTHVNGGQFDLRVVKLNSTYTEFTGSSALVKNGTGGLDTYEIPSMFKKGSTYIIAYGVTCPYCANSDTTIVYNTGDPIVGTWTQGAALNTTSCGGQLGGVSKLSVGGSDLWLLWADLWKTADPTDTTRIFGYRQQGQANFFEIPLTFTGDLPNAYTCDSTYDMALTADSTNNAPAGLHVTSVADNYYTFCDIRADTWRAQKFVTTSSISKLRIMAFKNVLDGTACNDTVCPDISVDLRITVNFPDGSGLPGAVVQTIDLTASSVKSAPKMYDVNLGSLAPGTYWYVMRPASSYTGGGAYCFGYNDDGGNYSGSAAAASFTGGSSWAVEHGGVRDLMFQAIVGAPNVRWGTQGFRWGPGKYRRGN